MITSSCLSFDWDEKMVVNGKDMEGSDYDMFEWIFNIYLYRLETHEKSLCHDSRSPFHLSR
jgi:hypothetical protein